MNTKYITILNNAQYDNDIGLKLAKLKYKDICPFPELESIWNNIEPATFKDIALIENIEYRRIGFSILGTENFINDLNLEFIDKQTIKRKNRWLFSDGPVEAKCDETYELYRILNKKELGLYNWRTYQIVKFKDTSTDRVYIIWLMQEYTDAIEAIASTFRTKVKKGYIKSIIRQGDCMLIEVENFEDSMDIYERPLTKEEYINLVVNES